MVTRARQAAPALAARVRAIRAPAARAAPEPAARARARQVPDRPAPAPPSNGSQSVTRRVLPPAIGLLVAFGLLIPSAAHAQGNGRPKGPKSGSSTSTPT